ncbi:hypothetical protein B0T18DRAFT_47899 [Schizothecium vesticola]|uniref:Uncharacterized protein n=1 Tax=Schizothecium vesticola TaxID=314040 RepID=A0AA40FBT1_9PEZI|nr:hypothetical protein B0T18DRAFT_47899 [Schizothecium vesticola]
MTRGKAHTSVWTACQQTTASPSWPVIVFLRFDFRCILGTKRELLVVRHPFDRISTQRHVPSQSHSRFELPAKRPLGLGGVDSWFQNLNSTGHPGLGHLALSTHPDPRYADTPRTRPAMCYAASSVHPCGHAATRWSYCPESGMVGVGTTPPDCTEKTWGNASKTSARCPLVYCSFQAGSTWTCCNCGGSDNTGGWCTHERGRWVRDDFAQRPCWIEKCEHNCCPNCTRDGMFIPLPT